MQGPTYIAGHGDGVTNPTLDLESVKRCHDCGNRVEWYWMDNFLWAQIVDAKDHRAWICVRCIGRRLGRPLTPNDLTDGPVNRKPALLERLSIPYGYCYCNCGEKTSVAPKTNRAQGQIKGEPNRFLPGHQNRKRTPQYEERDLGYETPCWFWLGAKDRLGYGLVHRGGCTTVAHKWHYECVHGPIPAGFELDHLCRQRSCVNPDHFEVVTHDENIRRGLSPTAINARKTHCNRGHEFTPENTYLRPDTGARECRTCKRAGMKAWWAANRSRPPTQSSGVPKL